MKLSIQLLFIFTALFFLSCDCEEEMQLPIECPCLQEGEQVPYYKSCEEMGEDEERRECMKNVLLSDIYRNLYYPQEAID